MRVRARWRPLRPFSGSARLRTALLDADLQFGDLAALMGDAPSVPVEEVARTGAVPDELSGARWCSSALRALERSEVVAASMGSVVDVLVASFDFVIANTGAAGTTCISFCWNGCRLPVLVDQRASSVRACRHALDCACAAALQRDRFCSP